MIVILNYDLLFQAAKKDVNFYYLSSVIYINKVQEYTTLSYIGQTKRSLKTRVKEHIPSWLKTQSKSAICEHDTETKLAIRCIRFYKPQVLATEYRFQPRTIRETIEKKRLPNFNREDGWPLLPWDPIIKTIKPKPSKICHRLKTAINQLAFSA